jgi:trimeric autotransporter adhesin
MTYVSVLTAQADPGIVSGSTIERKKMSTKTIYKRIALVAVAALGAGVLSVAPASAAYTTVFTAGSPAFSAQPAGTTRAADGAFQTQISGANNFVTVDVDAVAGVLVISGSTLATSATTGVTIAADKLSASQVLDAVAGTYTYTIPTKTAGTISVKFYSTTSGATSATVTDLLTITVNDAASYAVSAAKSTSIIDGVGPNYADALKDDVVVAVGTGAASAKVAQINVDLQNALGAALAAPGVSVTAVVSGSGLVSTGGTAARVAVQSGVTGPTTFDVFSDGTAGSGTITITAGTTVIATEKVSFSGVPTKVVATQNLQVTNGTTPLGAATFDATTKASNGAVTLTVTDANGNPVPNVLGAGGLYTIVATSSDKTVMSTGYGSLSATAGTGNNNGKGDYALTATAATAVAGKSATITYSIVNVATEAVLATSAPITFAVGGTTAATASLAFDKASYAPGEKATLTLTLKDADGFAIADGVTPVFATTLTAFAGLTTSASLTSAPFSLLATDAGTKLLGGKATATVFMPLASGPVTVSGKTMAGVAGTAGAAVTASTTVTTPANADITALTTLVNSLIAKINALNKLVIKIQKKVRA